MPFNYTLIERDRLADNVKERRERTYAVMKG